MKQKELYTVSEFAKLRNLTAETLRHYDRIGLLKPAYIDPETNYRYYSIFQYEKLGTIKELRQLGVSLDVICDYFKDRNVEKSKAILEKCYDEIRKKKKEMEELEQVVKDKLEYFNNIQLMTEELTPKILKEKERYVFSSASRVRDEDAMGYEWTILEKNLTEISPILASSRIGYFFTYQEDANVDTLKKTPFIFSHPSENGGQNLVETIPAGEYLDIYVRGYRNLQKPYDLMGRYMKENGYRPAGKVMTFFPVDVTVTDEEKEGMMELQVAVEKIER